MNKGITVAGNLIVDYIKVVDAYPGKGMLSNISEISRCIGGCAANTLIDLAVMDNAIPLQCIGMVGGDEDGRYIISLLKSHNIDVSQIAVHSNAPTSFTDVITEKSTGERTFFHARGANSKFSVENIDFKRINPGFFHIGYALLLDAMDSVDPEYGTVMARTLSVAKESGLMTSMDVVSENSRRYQDIVIPSLKYCDFLIINEVEGERISGIEARNASGELSINKLEQICGRLLSFGVSKAVIIHAPEGACAMSNDRKFTYEGSYILPEGFIKGTVGAGDAFCAGILYSLYNEYNINKTLKIAAGAAACNLTSLDSISGMKRISEIEGLIDCMNQRILL
jgi:sugar/nucleoside kinase (ribokinase family)